MFDFQDKSVIVTGATSGIGKEIARAFYAAGAKVAVCGRKNLEEAVQEIAGGHTERLYAERVDVSDLSQLENFFNKTVEKFGRIDILINNAGVQFPKPSVEVTAEDWQRTVDINLRGYFFGATLAAKDMMRRGEAGSIVNIGSVNAVTVVPGQAVYAATKAGISQMTKSLAREWGKQGIRVNCIAPGSIPTAINASIYADPAVDRAMCEKIPMGRRGQVHEVADATLYMASPYASYVTGQTLFVDGGLTLVHG